MMKKVKKAVIPAAGYGTRFLPITKGISKEMLPIIDIPTIEYVIKEAIESGIKEIILVISTHKKDIEQYYTSNKNMEKFLIDHNKKELVKVLQKVEKEAKFTFVYQKEQKGLGHAVYCAKDAVGDEPFAVLLGDDVDLNYGGEPVTKQLLDTYYKVNHSVVGVQKVNIKDINKYASIKYSKHKGNTYEIIDMIEKPKIEEAPSNVAILGRYILTPDIFKILKTQKKGIGGEIQLTDAIQRQIKKTGVTACEYKGERYDVGTKFGYIKLTLDEALRREDLSSEVKKYIVKKSKE